MKQGIFFRSGASMKRLLAFIFSMFIIALGIALLFIPDVRGNNFSLLQQIIGGSFIMVGTLLIFYLLNLKYKKPMLFLEYTAFLYPYIILFLVIKLKLITI